MIEFDYMQSSLPLDIALKIASSLQVPDLCSLGRCSKFWREVCGSDCLWESLSRERWPCLFLPQKFHSSDEQIQLHSHSSSEGWRSLYTKQHYEMAGRAASVVKFVQQSSPFDFIEVGDYLRAIHDLHSMQLGFRDVQLFLFKPSLSVFLNLAGLHYCITWLQVPSLGCLILQIEANLHVSLFLRLYMSWKRFRVARFLSVNCVRWWKLGRWFYGFRMRDESHLRQASLADLAASKEGEVMAVLNRGAIHEVLRVQISVDDSTSTPWPGQRTHG